MDEFVSIVEANEIEEVLLEGFFAEGDPCPL